MKTRLLVHHVSKDRNLETLLKLSSFFNLDEVVMVGRRKLEKMANQQNDDEGVVVQESTSKLLFSATENSKIKGYKYFREALQDLQIVSSQSSSADYEKIQQHSKSKRHILVGIEIEPGAVPANKLRQSISERFPNCESVTFMPGNEGEGLIDSEKECCDMFVYVQQFFRVVSSSESAAGGAGSLNVATSVAVTLSQFFEPSDDSTKQPQHHKLLLFPILHFSPEAEQSRRVHFLIRPCTAFGANFVSVICASQKAFMGDKGNRSSFGKNMSSELHCPMESYSSVFQAVRDLKEMMTLKNSLIVVGVEINSVGDVPFQNQLEKFSQTFLARNQEKEQEVGIALLFCDLAFDSDGKLSENEKKFCDFVVSVNHRQVVESGSDMNLPCLVSIVLHRFSVFFGFSEGKQQIDENINKFSVMLKRKLGDTNQQQTVAKVKDNASKPAASNNKGFELEDGDDESGFFGGMM